jgi:60 kDa SS-A/Ro ribonucleoprotein
MLKNLRNAAKTVGTPPQSQPLDAQQIPNSAGGYSYEADVWKRLERFLILGVDGPSYYASEQKLTFENIKSLEQCVALDGPRTVAKIVEISDKGRAPKNDPALFALAYCIAKGDLKTRREASFALPKVARIGTHLFHFASFAQDMRGWGSILKRAIGDWYMAMPFERLVEQLIKYRQRDGYTHGDLLRQARPLLPEDRSALAKWALASNGFPKWANSETAGLPSRLRAHIQLQTTTDVKSAAALIREERLTWESVPTELLKSPTIWEALLENMPMTALIRNLGRMTSIGLIKPLSTTSKEIASRLTDTDALKRARVHPISILVAGRTYGMGHGDKGSLAWSPEKRVCEALDEAFYKAFQFVEPSGKNFYLALDISDSMGCRYIAGMSNLTPREGSVAMAMVTARCERNYYLRGFSHHLVDLPITSKTTLNDAVGLTAAIPMGGTDCALPMLDATKRKLEVDCFVVITDSETWFGNVHPMQALKEYRQAMSRPHAKLVVVGMLANKFSIADPKDFGALDLVGFDTASPALISEFAKQ